MSESTTPTPEPMTPKQLTEIRERAAWVAETGVAAQEADQLVLRDVPALLAEVQRLRSELDDQRTLYGTAKAIAEQATKWHTDARAELAETTHVLAVTGEKLTAVRGQRDRAETDRDTARAAQERLIAEVKDERRRRADYVRTVETERDQLRTLLRDMVDPAPCHFDHHGGCQAHGYLNLQPGEKCPHAEAKDLLALGGTEADR